MLAPRGGPEDEKGPVFLLREYGDVRDGREMVARLS